jgi:hypothetical protein
MTSPRERVRALAAEAEARATEAIRLGHAGLEDAALAAEDQAAAADAHARKVAADSGDTVLMSLWDES